MVTSNVETDLDTTNDACGEIIGIVFHEDEPPIGHGPIVKLNLVPSHILTDQAVANPNNKIGWIGHSVIAAEPLSTSYRIRMTTRQGKNSSA
jgi:hypothetical protein